MLYAYPETSTRIEKSRSRIQEYNDIIKTIEESFASPVSPILSDMPKGTPQPYEDKLLRLIEKKDQEVEKLNKLIQQEQNKIARMLETYNLISKVLSNLTDKQRDLIEQFYFEKQRRIDVCSDMEISISTFRRINNTALDKIKEELDKEDGQ